MLRKTLLIAAAFGVCTLAMALGGCEKKTTIGAPAVETCDINLHALEGMYIAQKAAPDRGEYLDKDFRMFFYNEGGKSKVLHTGGRVYPELPLTEKFPYEFSKWMNEQETEALYTANLVFDFNAEELEKEKKDNKNLGWKVEGMLYIRVDDKRCRLQVSDMYATYVEGKRIEDFNMGGQSPYVKSEEQGYSMVSCPPARHRDRPEDNRQGELIAWNKADPDPNRDDSYPRGRKGTLVPVGEEVHWIWIDPEMNEKNAKEDCNYWFSVWLDDLPVEGMQHVDVTPGNKWTYWGFSMTHEALEDPQFIEIHRHEVCGGVDKTIEAVCNVVATEKPAEEGAAEGGAEG